MLYFLRTLKGTSLRGTASFDVFCVNVRGGVLAVGDEQNQTRMWAALSNIGGALCSTPQSLADAHH